MQSPNNVHEEMHIDVSGDDMSGECLVELLFKIICLTWLLWEVV